MSKEKIGFIGLGAMGSRMAKNIIKSGYSLSVYNRTPSRTQPLSDLGASVFDSPKALAENSDIIIVMVTGPEALHEVIEAENGAAAGIKEGARLVNMSTVSYEATMRASAEIACRKAAFIDAPVSGTIKPAEEGSLVILASGDREEIDHLGPLLKTMGKEVIYCGGVGKGTCMKLTVNLLLANMMEGFAEALTLGGKLGLELQEIIRVIESGPMAAPMFKAKGQTISSGDYTKTFPVNLAFKDLNLILDAAAKACVPLPSTSATRESFNAAVANGYGDEDIAAVIKIVRAMAGIK